MINNHKNYMKTLISYRHTGADVCELEALLSDVQRILTKHHIEPYCTFFDSELCDPTLTAGDIMKRVFPKIEAVDFLFVIINSESKSEGMLMEIGYAIAKNIPVIIAKQSHIRNSYVHEVAAHCIEWQNLAELISKLEELLPLKGANFKQKLMSLTMSSIEDCA